MESNTAPGTTPQPLIIFVIGAPCSGKSTLCKALSDHFTLEYVSVSGELRDLVKATPTNRTNRLAQPELTAKYMKERIFGVGASPRAVRVLVDGFPRDLERWQCFKEIAKDCFKPTENTFSILLDINPTAAKIRWMQRARPGDDFVERIKEYLKNEDDVRTALMEDGVQGLEVRVGAPEDSNLMQVVVSFLAERMDAWADKF